jgi:TolB-like protein
VLAAAENHPAIIAELDRVLAWPEIARSPQLGRFLDYIVRETLEGDEQAIKAYSIAVDVFGRPADFDPQSDPIVRVQARRLRSLLDQYYATAGADNVIRITLPVGRYLPLFEANNEAKVDASPEIIAPTVLPEPTVVAKAGLAKGDITLSWFTLLVITSGIAALAYSLSTWEPRQSSQATLVQTGPSVTIVEFQDLTGPGSKPVVAGLALELVTDLDAFEDIDARYGGVSVTAPPNVAASEFMLTGIVRRAEAAVQYSAILTETASGTVVWSRTIAVDEQRSMQPDALDEISQSLSLVLGSPRGPLHLPARKALNGGLPADGAATLYLCRVLFDLYREVGTSASGVTAATCFARLSATDQQAPMALAAEASLIGEGMVTTDAPALALDDRLRIAGTNLERATALAPLSGFVWEQQGRWLELQRDFDAASAAYASSIQLNPANADVLAAAARLLAFQGNLAEAEALAGKAVAGSPLPPPWYYAVPTLVALQGSHFQIAISNAQTYDLSDPELGSVMAVVAACESGNASVLNRYLPQVLEVASFRASGIMPRLRQRIGDAALLDRISKALTTAGVPPQALTGPF